MAEETAFYRVAYPNGNPNETVVGTGAYSEGYGVINARIKFCQLEQSGQHRSKRYQMAYVPVQSNQVHVSDMVLASSAKDQMNFSGNNTQTRRYATSDTYTPEATNENIVMNKFRFNMTAGDLFTGFTVGPAYSAGYIPFKIYRPTLVYRLCGLRV